MGDYKGLIDIGIKYRFSSKQDFAFGVSLNANYLTYSVANPNISFDTKNYNIQPRIFGELQLKGLPRFHPALGLGYTFMNFSSSGSANTAENPDVGFSDSASLNAINYNISFSYDFFPKIFGQIQYDGLKIQNTPKGVPDTKYNTTASLIKIGIGYRF
ncbi:MAG: hypothetical protein RL427_1450 [Bacteroidota bacterium]